MNAPSQSDDSFELVDLINWITFKLYKWRINQAAFLQDTWLVTINWPESYMTYGEIVYYLWRVLNVQSCDNPVDMQDESTLYYAMKRVAWSETSKLQSARESETCAGTGYMCIAKLIKASTIAQGDKVKYLAWVNKWFISDEMISFLGS